MADDLEVMTAERDALRSVANLRTCLGMIAWGRRNGRDDIVEWYVARGRVLREYLREPIPESDA